MANFIKEETITLLQHQDYDKIKENMDENPQSIAEFLLSKANQYSNKDFVGAINKSLQVEFMSYGDLIRCSRKLGEYLIDITEPKEIIGIASVNRPEWLIAEQATYFCNCVNSPLYTTFKEEALSYIISTTNMRILIASPSFAELIADNIIGFIPSELIKLEYIIFMENNDEIEKKCSSKGLKVLNLLEILFKDSKKIDNFYSDPSTTICSKASRYFLKNKCTIDKPFKKTRELPKPDDLASICFTSGTTGVPKGVQLTHRNFISQIEAYVLSSKNDELIYIGSSDVYFSYLPLSHVLERACIYFCLYECAKICFFRGDKLKIGEDLNIIKPSLFASVPKVLQAFYSKIEAEVAKKKFYERFIYRSAMGLKIFLQKFNIRSVRFLDEKIFKKIAANFGGNIREILCGGAAVDPYLVKYFSAIFGAKIFLGYGQTEGLGANLIARRNMNDASTIGLPFPSTKVKLVSLDSSKNSFSHEKSLLLKGHCIMKGYFIPPSDILKKLLDTRKFSFSIDHIKENPFDEDGWLITGDVVTFKNNKIYIVGRSKDLVKLDNGEYISPENIENRLLDTKVINDVFISKIKGQDKFTALVSVAEESVNMLKIANYIRDSINLLISAKVIPRCFEIAKFAIIKKNFLEIEEGILFTPTLKKKRFLFEKKFEKEIKNAKSIESFLSGDFDSRKIEPKILLNK